MAEIRSYDDFIAALTNAGFSMAGDNDEGIYAIITWGWRQPPPYDTPVEWHGADPEYDPWEWTSRVLDERSDIAYGKLFFRKCGYITEPWIPHFLAARRGDTSFYEAYEDGTFSHYAKQIYDIVAAHDRIPVHDIKKLAGFGKRDKSGFDRALTDLQMRMYISTCGRQQKLSQKGEAYGWSSSVFCTTDNAFGHLPKISAEEAHKKIHKQILKLNPSAQENKIKRFIKG